MNIFVQKTSETVKERKWGISYFNFETYNQDNYESL